MAKTVEYGKGRPSEEHIEWFVKHVGPRTHYLMTSVGGKGWRFTLEKKDNTWANHKWYLTVEDEKMLMYWILVR